MAKVIISEALSEEVSRKFKQDSLEIFDVMKSLEKSPNKGKALSSVGGVVIKEVKYKTFRFYFITDGHVLKFGTEDELSSLLIKFIKMSDKKEQQKVINQIKDSLRSLGFDKLW
jgi:hypothetical protein